MLDLRTTVLVPVLCPSWGKASPSIRVAKQSVSREAGTRCAHKTKEFRKAGPQIFPHGLKILLDDPRAPTAHFVVRNVVAEVHLLPQPADGIRDARTRDGPELRVPPLSEARVARGRLSRHGNALTIVMRQDDEQIGDPIEEFPSQSATPLRKPPEVLRRQDREIRATESLVWVRRGHLVDAHQVVKDDGENVEHVVFHGEADGSS